MLQLKYGNHEVAELFMLHTTIGAKLAWQSPGSACSAQVTQGTAAAEPRRGMRGRQGGVESGTAGRPETHSRPEGCSLPDSLVSTGVLPPLLTFFGPPSAGSSGSRSQREVAAPDSLPRSSTQ